MTRFSKNKEIVKICKNYYKIVNCDLYKNDRTTANIINLYTDYVFSINSISQIEKDRLVLVDNIMYKFITDSRFKKEITVKLSNLKVSQGITNIVEYVMNKLIEYFDEYKDTYTRNIYIPRWI